MKGRVERAVLAVRGEERISSIHLMALLEGALGEYTQGLAPLSPLLRPLSSQARSACGRRGGSRASRPSRHTIERVRIAECCFRNHSPALFGKLSPCGGTRCPEVGQIAVDRLNAISAVRLRRGRGRGRPARFLDTGAECNARSTGLVRRQEHDSSILKRPLNCCQRRTVRSLAGLNPHDGVSMNTRSFLHFSDCPLQGCACHPELHRGY